MRCEDINCVENIHVNITDIYLLNKIFELKLLRIYILLDSVEQQKELSHEIIEKIRYLQGR